MVCQDRPLSCLEGFEGLPLLWEQHTVLPEPGARADLPLLRAPRGFYPGASSLPAHQPPPFRAHGLVLQRGSRCAGVPMLPRGCSLARVRCPCPACALNFCHTSPL